MSYLIDLPQGGEYLAGDIAFEAADHIFLAHPIGDATAHVCPGSFVMTQSDDHDSMQRRVGLVVAAAVEAMAVGPPRGGGNGFTPQREAKAASVRRRWGLLPAATSRVAAMSGPIPKLSIRSGAAALVSRSSSASRSLISLPGRWEGRVPAILESAALACLVGPLVSPHVRRSGVNTGRAVVRLRLAPHQRRQQGNRQHQEQAGSGVDAYGQ